MHFQACKAIGPVHCHPLTDMVLLEMPATVYAMRHLGHRDPKDARLAAYTLLRSSLDALVLQQKTTHLVGRAETILDAANHPDRGGRRILILFPSRVRGGGEAFNPPA